MYGLFTLYKLKTKHNNGAHYHMSLLTVGIDNILHIQSVLLKYYESRAYA